MAQRGEEDVPSSPTSRPIDREDLSRLCLVVLERDQRRPDSLDERRVAQDVAEHRLGALVVGVQLAQSPHEPLVGVIDRTPRLEVRPWVGREVVR